MERYLVIGAGGFIGQNLVRRLVQENGEREIICVEKREISNRILGCRYLVGDYSSKSFVESLIDEDTKVIHLAWNNFPNAKQVNASEDIVNNVLATVNLLECLVKRKAKSIVFLSSGGGVYGRPCYLPIDEKHPTNPISIYGVNKLAVENYVRLFTLQSDLKGIIIRPSNPYGAFQRPFIGQGIISTFMASALLDKEVNVWGDGKAVRDYIYVDDLIDAIIKACNCNEKLLVTNVGCGLGTSINEIIDMIQQITKKRLHVNYTGKTATETDGNVLDCKVAEKILGWRSKVTLYEGMEKMLLGWNEHSWQFDRVDELKNADKRERKLQSERKTK